MTFLPSIISLSLRVKKNIMKTGARMFTFNLVLRLDTLISSLRNEFIISFKFRTRKSEPKSNWPIGSLQ